MELYFVEFYGMGRLSSISQRRLSAICLTVYLALRGLRSGAISMYRYRVSKDTTHQQEKVTQWGDRIKPFLFCLEFRAFFFFILEFPVIFSLKYTEILLHLSSQLFTAVPAPMRALFGPFPCNGAMTSDPVGRLCARARAYVSSLDVLIVTASTSQSSPLLPA